MTDFEQAGLSHGQVELGDRQLHLTVDFEAFRVDTISAWCHAMEEWTCAAQRARLVFSFFISVEDCVRLRLTSEDAYAQLTRALHRLVSGGSRLYPHNHCVFDPRTGAVPGESSGFPQHVPGYRSRASMFYDVVHRQGHDLTEWLGVVTAEYERLLADVGVAHPSTASFRPGGWDHGSTPEELRIYTLALSRWGYRIDSSATSGTFGESSWRVGAPFGANAYRLNGGLLELAASWSVNCGTSPASRTGIASLAALARQPRLWGDRGSTGAMVTVLHFDHLFHDWRGGTVTVCSPSRARPC